MREHIAPFVYYLEVHLLYASILCLTAWALTSIRSANATWKYWIWVATSVNFILPLAGFFNGFAAARVSWATQLGGLDGIGIGISRNLPVAAVLFIVWLLGAAVMLARLLVQLQLSDSGTKAPHPTALTHGLPAHGIPVVLSAVGQSPSVDGLLRPYISLPLEVG